MGVRSASAAVEDHHYSEGWSTSLCLCWRFSSSLVVDREATIRLDGSVAHLFSEAGSSLDLRLFSPIAGLSLGLEGAGLACCCCGRAGRVEGASLEWLVWCDWRGGSQRFEAKPCIFENTTRKSGQQLKDRNISYATHHLPQVGRDLFNL